MASASSHIYLFYVMWLIFNTLISNAVWWTRLLSHLLLRFFFRHYSDVIMNAMAYQTTGVSMVCLTVCSGTDQRKLRRSASLAFVRGMHQWPVNSPHKLPITRKMFPFYNVIKNFQNPVRLNTTLTSVDSAYPRENLFNFDMIPRIQQDPL